MAGGPACGTTAVAIAHTAGTCCDGRAAAWVADGTGTWTALTADALGALGMSGPGAGFVADVAPHAGGFVAVGSRPAGPDEPRPVPAAWTTADGRRWEAAEVAGAPVGGGLAELGRTADGLVAFGTVGDRAASWTSADGARRERQPLGAGLDNATAVRGTASGPPEVAWGTAPGPDGESAPALWVSAGDSGWQYAHVSHLGDELERVLAFDGGFAAFGTRFEPAGHATTKAVTAVYVSPDGADWQHVVRLADVRDVLASQRHGLVAVGASSDGSPALWASSDGRQWDAHAEDAFGGAQPAALHGIAELADGSLVVGGAVGPDDLPQAAVWTWRPPPG